MEGPPPWDEELGEALIGARVLVGLTITSIDDTVLRQEQIFGTVVAANSHGVTLDLEGSRSGTRYTLPPDPRAFEPASPGEYRLRSTGEVVVNPEYLSTWTIRQPAKH